MPPDVLIRCTWVTFSNAPLPKLRVVSSSQRRSVGFDASSYAAIVETSLLPSSCSNEKLAPCFPTVLPPGSSKSAWGWRNTHPWPAARFSQGNIWTPRDASCSVGACVDGTLIFEKKPRLGTGTVDAVDADPEAGRGA